MLGLVLLLSGCDRDGSAGSASIDSGSADCTALTWFADGDSDGYGNDGASITACTAPAGHVGSAGDCDDADASVHPLARDECGDGVDQNCVAGDRVCGEYASEDAEARLEIPGAIVPWGLADWGAGARLVAPTTAVGPDATAYEFSRDGASVASTWTTATDRSLRTGAIQVGGTLRIAVARTGEDGVDEVLLLPVDAEGPQRLEDGPAAWDVPGSVGHLALGAELGEVGEDLVLVCADGCAASRPDAPSGVLEEWAVLDAALTPVGDVDGDGLPDLVAATTGSEGGLWWGELTLVPGPLFAGEARLADLGRATWEGGWSTTNGGSTLTLLGSLGDVTGDGLVELAFGDHGWSHDGSGFPAAVYVLSSDAPSGGLPDLADATFEEGEHAASLGDIDGDGRSELVVESADLAWIVAGPVTGVWDAAALAGRTRFDVSCGWWDRCAFELVAGDLDDDGAMDLVFLGEQRTAYDEAGHIASAYEYLSFFGPFD